MRLKRSMHGRQSWVACEEFAPATGTGTIRHMGTKIMVLLAIPVLLASGGCSLLFSSTNDTEDAVVDAAGAEDAAADADAEETCTGTEIECNGTTVQTLSQG